MRTMHDATEPPAMAALVRPGTEADIEEIAAIYAHHVRHGTASFETEPPSVAEMRRRRAELVARDYPYLVADADRHVVGYAYAGPYRPRLAYRDTVENSVYLRCDAIGRGIRQASARCPGGRI